MSDNPQGVFIDGVEFPFDDSSSVLEFSNFVLTVYLQIGEISLFHFFFF